MRYIRHSLFDPSGKHSPLTMVFPEESLKADIWTAANQMRIEAASLEKLGGFLDIEIFEHEGDFLSATMEAKKRAEKRIDETTRHKNTLYDFLIATFKNGLLADKGTVSTTRPSPLEKKDILEVLLRAVKHPSYRGFKVVIHDRNTEPVEIRVDSPTGGVGEGNDEIEGPGEAGTT